MAPRQAFAYIDEMEGRVSNTTDDDDNDDDDLAANPHEQRSNSRLRRDLEQTPSTAADSDDPDDDRTRRPPPFDGNGGIKVEWSEDEGLQHSLPHKRRKSLKPSKPHKPRRAANTNAVVGKKSKTTRPRPITARPYSSSSEEDDRIEQEQPEYLRKRKSQFNRNHEALGDAGLRLPLNYEDIEFSDDERLETLQERPQLPNISPCANYEDIELPRSGGIIPAPVAQWLRVYQVQGAAFLHELFVYQKGGILGDDMGLGKTIQVVAFLIAAFGKTGDERDRKRMRKLRRAHPRSWYPRVLIICPGSLMDNWKSELHRWGWFNVDTFHGSPREKDDALTAAETGYTEILVTTYTTYRIHRDKLNMVEWDCVIADECHAMKEVKSGITQAMDEINALCRIGLTGTAIQNRYEELWTLLNWTNPGRFGPLKSWKAVISEPLKIGQSHDATIPQLAKARTTAKKLANNLLPRFFLRRTKALIADQLPKKTDRVVFCPLTDAQSEAYENFLASETIEAIRTATDPCDCDSGLKRGWCHHKFLSTGESWKSRVFPSMETVRKLSNHLATLIPQSTDPPEQQSKQLETLQWAMPSGWRELYSSRDSILNYANQDFCGKWRVLKRLLAFWFNAGDKVLVFSHSVRLLRMLRTLFNATTSYTVSYLDGSMSYDERTQTVDAFNSSPDQFVFLISTRAGGVGLNITSANKVVVVDPNWNPAHDLQAQDRAYRIGQVRDVEVFRLVSAGTIEEIVYARQVYKQQQANIGYSASSERRYFRGVQDRRGQKGEIFGLANIFAFQSDGLVLRDIVNKTNIAESRAGVSVVGLDMDSLCDDEDADAGLGRVTALLSQDNGDGNDVPSHMRLATPAAVANPVAAILANAGVQYTHENSEMLGPSRIEARLSRRAEEAADAPERVGEHVFVGSSQLHGDEIEDIEDDNDDYKGRGQSHGDSNGDSFRRKWHPPEAVRRRQFCEMARTLGWGADVTAFALAVEGWTQHERRAALERFYRLRGASRHDVT